MMKRSTTLKKMACLTIALAALAAPAVAQPDIDLELTEVQVLVAKQSGEFQLLPVITLHNFGNLASHALDVAMYYAPIGVSLITDVVEYHQGQDVCWQQSILNCGNGDCYDIYLGLGWMDGFCTSDGTTLARCGCSYIINREFEWTNVVPGEMTVTVMVDPDNVVPETDETNNTIIIDLMPISNENSTWSAIKSMYQ